MFDTSKIGQSFPPYTIEVERGKVGELALAIGDTITIRAGKRLKQRAMPKCHCIPLPRRSSLLGGGILSC